MSKGGIKSACLCDATSSNAILLSGVRGDLHSIYLPSQKELGLICKVHEIFTINGSWEASKGEGRGEEIIPFCSCCFFQDFSFNRIVTNFLSALAL